MPDAREEEHQQHLQHLIEEGNQAGQQAVQYADWLITTMNAEVPDEQWRLPQPHPSAVPPQDIQDEQQDYQDLVNSVERHTRCSAAYCLRYNPELPEPYCRFGYPKSDVPETELSFLEFGDNNIKATLMTKRNDPRINSHNRVMLQNWRANVDMQIIVDADACARYLTKYAAKGEPTSKQASTILNNTMDQLRDTDTTSSVLKRAMIQVAGERDISAQETAHMLLSTPLYGSTFQFITLSLDNSRQLQLNNEDDADQPIKSSLMDHYALREQHARQFPGISQMNLLQFASEFYTTRNTINRRKKTVIVRTFPRISSDSKGKKYGLFCKYQLIKYKPWTDEVSDAWYYQEETDDVFVQCYREFLSTPFAQQHVKDFQDDIENAMHYIMNEEPEEEDAAVEQPEDQQPEQEDWMLLCQLNTAYQNDDQEMADQNIDWNEAARNYPQELLRECPKWIMNKRKEHEENNTSLEMPQQPVDPATLNDQQRLAYDIITSHSDKSQDPDKPTPLALLMR